MLRLMVRRSGGGGLLLLQRARCKQRVLLRGGGLAGAREGQVGWGVGNKARRRVAHIADSMARQANPQAAAASISTVPVPMRAPVAAAAPPAAAPVRARARPPRAAAAGARGLKGVGGGPADGLFGIAELVLEGHRLRVTSCG